MASSVYSARVFVGGSSMHLLRKTPRGSSVRMSRCPVAVRAHKVEITFEGVKHTLEVAEGESILDVGRDAGMELPCDCMMGVCMECPAKMVSGVIDQGAGMLSEDTIEKGYTLLCTATPKSDCVINCIEEVRPVICLPVTVQPSMVRNVYLECVFAACIPLLFHWSHLGRSNKTLVAWTTMLYMQEELLAVQMGEI